MDKKKVLELAQQCQLIGMRPHLDGIYEQSLQRFATLIEREVRGDAEPVEFDAFITDGRVKFRVGNQYFTLEYNSEDKDELGFMRNMLVSALARLASCPAPAVVRQLVENERERCAQIADAFAEGSRSARTIAQQIREGVE